MQGDLISRVRLRTEVDLLLKDRIITPNTMAMLHRLIDEQPTAYSVEKVETQIDNLEIYFSDDCNDALVVLDDVMECVWNGGKE